MPKSYTSRSKTHSYREVMKKFFFVGIVSLLACTAEANAAQITTDFTNDTGYTVYASASPKVIKKGDRVIIIYDDGKTIVVDKDGSVTTVPVK